MKESADALIARYLDGDMAAFERLYLRYSARLLGFLISLGGGREMAEDVAQKAWVKTIEVMPTYRPEGRFRPWLFTVAHRLWLDERGSAWERKRVFLKDDEKEPTAPQALDAGDGPLEQAERSERRALVDRALAELPEEMRRTVLLRVDGDLTHREIAEAMDCPLGTALWRMSEAQKRLCERLSANKTAEEKKGAQHAARR